MRAVRVFVAGISALVVVLPSAADTAAETVAQATACVQGYVALTFDDGPSATTPAILKALHDNGRSRATFFNIGVREQLYPGLVRQEGSARHEAGDHTYSHPFLDELPIAAAANEILGTQQIHEQITGDREELFRPPYGRTSPAIRRAARSMGMIEVLWTIDTRDYAAETTVHDVVSRALSARAGDIVLMHDSGYATTVAALPTIIAGLARRGLCLGRVEPTRQPLTAWPGARFYATAARW